MAKVKFIPCDIYKRGVHVFLGTYDEMMEWAKEYYHEEEFKVFIESMDEYKKKQGYCDTHWYNGYTIVRLACFPNTPMDDGAMAHELLHVVDYILDFCGVEWHSDSANEAYTYLLEWLVRCTKEDFGWEVVGTKKH